MSITKMFKEITSRYPQSEPIERPEPKPYCLSHHCDLPCVQCAENENRGYSVLQLAGRCANGFEGGHGVRWHAVAKGGYKAMCGATYGRRSAGWSSYEKVGQEVTCPKCQKKLAKAQSTTKKPLRSSKCNNMTNTKNIYTKNVSLSDLTRLAGKGKTRAKVSVRIRAAIRFFADMNEASFDRLVALQITREATQER